MAIAPKFDYHNVNVEPWPENKSGRDSLRAAGCNNLKWPNRDTTEVERWALQVLRAFRHQNVTPSWLGYERWATEVARRTGRKDGEYYRRMFRRAVTRLVDCGMVSQGDSGLYRAVTVDQWIERG